MRELALSMSLVLRVLSGVLRRAAPTGFVVLVVAMGLVVLGTGLGAVTVAVWLVVMLTPR